ncbi:flavin monoamine oxidase family protein [Gottfriedia acidiceleris]|uniref:flavin monoamine oxidase family protein n=1 Tax=Gottfriedia acidiceleris TaxID=371036 RepID=UPI0013EDFAC4|nr:NAD(P)/FAD-dependent oxidoreductase [Gottfriedia acidiceleris]
MVKIINNPNGSYDVIIVGAGFAGITASRELSYRGFKTLILEGRDRIGGRTWTDTRLGVDLELGGTWVHWGQPHVWTEITRYGLKLTPSPDKEAAYWFEEGKLTKGTREEFFAILGPALAKFLEESELHIPFPYDPLNSPTIEEIDKKSAMDRLNELNLDPISNDLLKVFLETAYQGSPELGGYATLLHWHSLAFHDIKLMLEILGKYKLKHGTKSLIEAIAKDSNADLQISTIVSLVEKVDDLYMVKTKDGGQFTAKAVIITAPQNVLKNIKFKPALSELKHMASIEGQTSRGVKYFARLRGKYEKFACYAPSGSILSSCYNEYEVDGDTIVVGFGPDATKIDVNDLPAIQREIRKWHPKAEVVACTGHNWTADELSGQTWNMQKKNQLVRYLDEFQRQEQGVFLSGCDYASGWPGMIDGAIESALVVSKKVERYLNVEAATLQSK